jgi:hypothetical protein
LIDYGQSSIDLSNSFVGDREAREGWPLPTVETQINGDSKSTNERGKSLVGSLDLLLPLQEIFLLPGLLKSAQYKIFFSSPYTI